MPGGTICEVIANIEKQFQGVNERLRDEQGQIRRFANVYVNGEDARFMHGLETPVKDGDEITIVPALAGG